MQDLVGLEVEAPVPRACVHREVGLDGVDLPVNEVRRIPRRLEDANARIINRADRLDRPVLARTDGDNELVDERKGGSDRLADGVVEADRVANEREPADTHSCLQEAGC